MELTHRISSQATALAEPTADAETPVEVTAACASVKAATGPRARAIQPSASAPGPLTAERSAAPTAVSFHKRALERFACLPTISTYF